MSAAEEWGGVKERTAIIAYLRRLLDEEQAATFSRRGRIRLLGELIEALKHGKHRGVQSAVWVKPPEQAP